MKSVLISIQPKWVEKIVSGEKTIEVRKTRPKLETPFKCYIYCTNGTQLVDVRKEKIYLDVNKPFLLTNGKSNNVTCSTPPQVNRKVIGEFVCDSVEMVNAKCSDYGIDLFYHDCMVQGCLTEREIEKYFNIPEDKDLRAMKGNGYAWHISDLKIYEKPKELSEFGQKCYMAYEIRCRDCLIRKGWNECCEVMCKPLKRPPQSWCYIESLGE